MPRTKIDFHQNRQDAASALSALREVGLDAGNVGGAWLAEVETVDDVPLTGPSQGLDVEGVGEVLFGGWLADVAYEACAGTPAPTLAVLFRDLTSDAAELVRIRDTLTSGGGLVCVRASHVFDLGPD